jgi:predicted DNA-binding transcriptional regulator AlpA
METNERIKWLLEATPEQLSAYDALRAGKKSAPPSLRLLRMGIAAKETQLSRTTLWRAIRDKRLKVVEVRKGSFRISENELRRFVEGAI